MVLIGRVQFYITPISKISNIDKIDALNNS